MAVVTIITKNNDAVGVVPSPGNLVEGELAVNTTDRKLYTLDNGGNVVLLSSGTDYDDPVTIDVSSSSAALRVTQRGSGNALLIEDSTNPDSTPFVVDNSGNTIVGYTAPLSFTGPAGTISPILQAVSPAGSLTQGIASTTHVTSGNGPNIVFAKSRGASASSPTIVSSGDAAGNLIFNAYDGAAYLPTAYIQSFVDGTPGTNDMPGRLVFSTTADGAATPTERLRITSTGALAVAGAANYGTQGQALISAGNAAPTWTDQFLSITFLISGGGSTVATGIAGDLTVPFGCAITEWTLLADQTGSIVVDIWKDTYANYPPTVADTITGSAKPTISAGVKGQSSTLTGWTTTITAGDTLRFNVDSATGMTRVTLSLKVKRT
jgi:hypothetical protein